MCESLDKQVTDRLNKRYIELSALFKEKQKGSLSELNAILAKFSLQEGVKIERAREYFAILKSAGLVKYINGHKSWRYDADAEWELFKIEV